MKKGLLQNEKEEILASSRAAYCLLTEDFRIFDPGVVEKSVCLSFDDIYLRAYSLLSAFSLLAAFSLSDSIMLFSFRSSLSWTTTRILLVLFEICRKETL
mmetsp:Transcript_12095/g.30520  ORF Transcript_12095/g.30520 Transcript_12095/m.30520 type:complete len:100 (-) Transcript_12095:1922-2221(-)